MRYRPMNDPAGADPATAIEITASVRARAAAQCERLRSRAEQCRNLVLMSSDLRIISELETYAAELDAEADLLARGLRAPTIIFLN